MRDIDAEADSVMQITSAWLDGIFAELGESPEAIRGALVLAETVINLCDIVRMNRDLEPHVLTSAQLVGVVGIVAGLAQRVERMGL